MSPIRKYFYLTSAVLSGTSLVTMTTLILAQIVARFMNTVIPSSEDFAGWLLSATIFFGLAYTFQEGGHIRVTMLVTRISDSKRRYLEFFNLVCGLLISGYLAFYTIFTVYDSFDYEEVTDTYLVVPFVDGAVPDGHRLVVPVHRDARQLPHYADGRDASIRTQRR